MACIIKSMTKKLLFWGLIIFSFLLLTPSQAQEKQRIYIIPVNYDRGQVSFGEVTTRLGYAPAPENPDQMEPTRYWIELVSFSGKSLEKRLFSIPLRISSPPPLPGEESSGPSQTILEQTQTAVILPYHKDGKTLYLSDVNGKQLAQTDVGYLAELCGDKTCEPHESYEDCPKDCPAAGKDDYCNLEKANQDPDCPKVAASQTSFNWFKIIIPVILVVILIIIAIFVVYFLSKRKKRKNSN